MRPYIHIKYIITICTLIIYLTTKTYAQDKPALLASCCEVEMIAKCIGLEYCSAYSDYISCKHRGNGGSCGVCSSRYKTNSQDYSTSSNSTKYTPTSRRISVKKGTKNRYYSTNTINYYVSANFVNIRKCQGTN